MYSKTNDLLPLLLLGQSLMPFSCHTYHISIIGHISAFLSGHRRFVWWFHIVELTLKTVKKTCDSHSKQTKYSAVTNNKHWYRLSEGIVELQCLN